MRKSFSAINHFFLPDRENIDVNKYSLLISFNWLTAIFSIFYVCVSEVISFRPGIYIMLGNFCMYLFNLILIKRKTSFFITANMYLFNSLFIAIYGCTWFSGGLFSPVIPWFVLVPVTSLLLLGAKKNTLVWLVVTSLCVLSFLFVARFSTIALPKNYEESWTDFFFYTCLGGLVLIIFIVTTVFENIKNNALQEASAKNEELILAFRQLKSAQEQLIQQEKLVSLGQLTAGIAHEIKNPLNFVNNFSQLSLDLLQDLRDEKDESLKEELFNDLTINLSKINYHGNNADFIVKSMLEHSRSGSGEFQQTDINKISEEYLTLAYHGFMAVDKGFNCELIKDLESNLPLVNCVAQDISRVILNLLNNALYAVKNASNPFVAIHTYSDNTYVYIEIRDNGTGMNEETLRKVFEPFYTTKPAGQGTGLGLSISFDIMKAHGGKLDVWSAVDLGTTFTMKLPYRKTKNYRA